MNERIQQLAGQAGFIDFIVFNRIESKEQVIEKFAQLIVRETMQVVANQLPSNQYLDVAQAVIEHYKEH